MVNFCSISVPVNTDELRSKSSTSSAVRVNDSSLAFLGGRD